MKYIDFLKKTKQKDMAKKLEISQKSVSNYINGRPIPIEILMKLSKIYNVSLDYLCNNEKKDFELLPKQEEIIEIIKTINDNNDLAQIKAYLLGFKDKELSTEEKIKNLLKDLS